jgi:NADH-quinone oxidoreductase subunit N
MFGTITSEMLQAILPEITLLVLIAIVLVIELLLPAHRRGILAWITAGGLLVTFAITVLFSQPGATPQELWGGMLRHDWLAFVFKLLFIFTAFLTTLLTINWESIWRKGEFYILLLTATMGMNLLAASSDLVMLFIAIETVSIPLYVMSGFMTGDDKSAEAGIKYLLFGAVTTGVMLYGLSLLYGFAGTSNLYDIAAGIAANQVPGPVLVGTLLLILLGFGFKVALVPLHFWAPDVYEGSPTPVTAFLSTASKAAGFAVLARVMIAAFPSVLADWQATLAIAAVLSMTVGNLIALAQRNIKRLLAYSSIAHAGYVLLGVAAASELGVLSVVYYLIAYAVTNMAAFAVIIIVSHKVGSDEIEDYAGLSRRSPMLALAMLLSFLSLAGIPPLGGFVAKVLVFAAAVDAGLVWLAVLGVLNSIIGLYYYLIVLKVIYLNDPKDTQPVPVARPHSVALVVSVVLVLVIGIVLSPFYSWASAAAASLF